MPRFIPPIAHKIDAVPRTNDVITEEKIDFSALHLSPSVLNGLRNAGFERPSPIQLKAIPIGRIGLDLIAQAKSGTGKTCVFGVIVLEAMNIKVQKCQCVVVAPTREIAAQIQTVISVLACDIQQLKCVLVIGGTNVMEDKESVAGAHIVIGTPGRLLHLIEDGVLDTECVRTLVLDEADKLVDESFYSQLKSLASQLPTSKQVLAMSATYHKDIDTKFNSLMRDPYHVRISADDIGLEGIHHYYYTVKTDKVKHQIFCNKIYRLIEILSNVTFEQCLVFSNYQTGAEEISVCLTREGFSNQLIAGNMAQKDRSQAMADFRECRFRVLISTDVTARGIDNEHVDLIVNMDLPVNTLGNPDPHTYLHRAGRAGRFGKYGSAISIIASQKEHMFVQDLEKYQIQVRLGPPYDQITDLLRRSKLPNQDLPPLLRPDNKLDETAAAPSDPKTGCAEASFSNDSTTCGSRDLCLEDLSGRQPEGSEGTRTSTHNASNGWFGSSTEFGTVADLNVLRSSVKVTQKTRPTTAGVPESKTKTEPNRMTQPDGKQEMDGDTALSSLGSLGKIPDYIDQSARLPSEDDTSVFNFSSRDVNTYQDDLTLFTEALGSLSLMPEDDTPSSNPSTCGSQKPPGSDNDGNEISRSRRGSKNQKKARKPPKSLNMASPKGQPNRRAQSAAAEFANSNILSPHTPKWRSEAVSSAGCIIHSKAINVKFLLENYLCLKYDFTDKKYDTDYRGFFPPKSDILRDSSTALCEIPACDEPEKKPITRFVSQGFVANPEHDPLVGKRTPPQVSTPPRPSYARIPEDDTHLQPKPCCTHEDPTLDDMASNSFNSANSARAGCQSTSSFGCARQQPCAHRCLPHHRPTDIPHLCREQSKDSGVFSYTSPYHCPPFCSAQQCATPPCGAQQCATPPCGTQQCATPPCYWWPHYMPPPMCGYPMPPPHCCSSCNSPQFNRHFSSAESNRHTPSGCNEPRHCSTTEQNSNRNSWNNAWEKAWEQ